MARKKKNAVEAVTPPPQEPDVVFGYETDDVVETKKGEGRILMHRVFEGEPLYWVMLKQRERGGVEYMHEEDILRTVAP